MTQPTFTLRVIAEITGQRSTLAATLASLADQHPRSAMAGRALSLQASPTSLGFIAAGLLEAVVSVLQRLSGVRETLSGEMGGAIGNLAVLTEIVRSRRPDVTQEATVAEVLRNFVQHLSLAAPDLSWHTHWMVMSELASVHAAATGVAGTVALDITGLSPTEIAQGSERCGQGEGGSSVMPHKRICRATRRAAQGPGSARCLRSW